MKQFAMVSTLIGAIVNIILDPVFIFIFRWGMKEAAMAAINNMLRKYGALDEIFGQAEYAQIPMAVVGIVMKFFQIVILIGVGMAAGCIPIFSRNSSFLFLARQTKAAIIRSFIFDARS